MKKNNIEKARYADCFILPLSVKNINAYRKMSQKAGKIWKEYGALDYKECAGNDLNMKMGLPFPGLMKLKPGETVVFAWITYKSRAHRDKINAKVMKDPRIANSMQKCPFDVKRMVYGGFKIIVDF